MIQVEPSQRRKIPSWRGSAQPIHRVVRERMEHICSTGESLNGLPIEVGDLVTESHSWYDQMTLDKRRIVTSGRDVTIVTFGGTKETESLAAILRSRGAKADSEGIAISVSCEKSEQTPLELIENILKVIISRPPTAEELVKFVTARRLPKFHERLPLELQQAETQADALDVAGAVQLAAKILSG